MNPTLILLLLSVIAAILCTVLALSEKKVQPILTTTKAISPIHLVHTSVENDFLPPLVDHPHLALADDAEVTFERREAPAIETKFDPIDDKETALLKAAEIVVEKVQDVISHIASNPPNPEEVTSKIKTIVNPYTIFHDTEYFDAINSFIAISVERDCNIQLTKEDLMALWN